MINDINNINDINDINDIKGVPSDSSFKMPDALRYIIPTSFLYGRQELKKNQRKIVALLLLQVKQWRDKLYEEDVLNGKQSIIDSPDIDKNKHFNDYVPDPSLLPKNTVSVTFRKDITTKMFGSQAQNVNRAIKLALDGIMGRVVHEEHIDTKGRKVVKMYTIIPRAILVDGEIEMSIDHDAVKRLMNHSFGYSDTDLDIWSELDSNYAQKLLEVISKNKTRANKICMSIDDFKFTFGCDFKTYTKTDILAIQRGSPDSTLRVGDFIFKQDEISQKMVKIPMYPRFSTFRERVLKPAFSELLKKSKGHWVATDDDGLGYRLIKKNKFIVSIEFCLKYIKKPDDKLLDDSNYQSECLALLEPLEKTILEIHNVKKIIDVTQERVDHWKMVINMYILHVEMINKSNAKSKYHNDSVDAAIIRFRELFAKK
jgi:hypothetical protein